MEGYLYIEKYKPQKKCQKVLDKYQTNSSERQGCRISEKVECNVCGSCQQSLGRTSLGWTGLWIKG